MRVVMWVAAGSLVLSSYVFYVRWVQPDPDLGMKLWDASDGKPEPRR